MFSFVFELIPNLLKFFFLDNISAIRDCAIIIGRGDLEPPCAKLKLINFQCPLIVGILSLDFLEILRKIGKKIQKF